MNSWLSPAHVICCFWLQWTVRTNSVHCTDRTLAHGSLNLVHCGSLRQTTYIGSLQVAFQIWTWTWAPLKQRGSGWCSRFGLSHSARYATWSVDNVVLLRDIYGPRQPKLTESWLGIWTVDWPGWASRWSWIGNSFDEKHHRDLSNLDLDSSPSVGSVKTDRNRSKVISLKRFGPGNAQNTRKT